MNSISKIIRISFAVFRTACLFIFLTGVALQFSPVQTYIMNTFVLNKNQTIEIDGFSGLFPFYFSFEKIKLYEDGQTLLKVKDLTLDWSLLKFLRYQIIAIQTLKINDIEYFEPPSKKSENTPPEFSLPKIPFGYIANINVRKAIYSAANQSFKYSTRGSTTHKETGLEFNLQLRNLDDQTNALTAHFKYGYSSSTSPSNISLNITGRESKGLLHYLIPTLKGNATLALKGSGQLDNFNGNLSVKLGETLIFGDLATKESSDNDKIDVITKITHSSNESKHTFLGTILINSALTTVELIECNLLSKESQLFTLSGIIDRKGYVISTKNLETRLPFSSDISVSTVTELTFDPTLFKLKGSTKASLIKNSESIASANIPFSMENTLDSLMISLKSVGHIPNLPENYQQFSKFEFSAKLEPGWFQSSPSFIFELQNDATKILGSLLLKDRPELKIDGSFLKHHVHLDSTYKNGSWTVNAKSNPLKDHEGIISNFFAKIRPQKNLNFDGKLKVCVESKNIDVEFKGLFDTAHLYLDVSTLRAVHKETYLESHGSMDFSRNKGDFSWHVYSFNIGDLFPQHRASGVTSVLGQVSIDPKDSVITFSGDFHKLAIPNYSAKSGNLYGSLQLTNNQSLHFSLTSHKALLNKTIVDEFSLQANGALDNFSTTVSMSGFSDQALKGNLAFSLLNLSKLELDALSIQLGHHKILLDRPTTWEYFPGQLIIHPTVINTDSGSLTIDGNMTHPSIVFNAALNKIPSSLFHTLTEGAFFLKGDLSGEAHVEGSAFLPTVKFNFKTENAPYATSVSGILQNSVLKTNIDIESNQFNLKVTGTYPTLIQTAPFDFELDHFAPFQTKVLATGVLDNVQQIFGLNYDKVFGAVDASILFTGTLDKPHLNGHLKIDNGRYERQNIGLILQNLNLELYSEDGQLILLKPSLFTDRKDGTGEIVFARLGLGQNLIPYIDTEIKFKNIHFIDLPQTRRGGMSAISTGNLKAKGPVTSLKIFSRGEISSFEKYIGETEDVPIYHVNVEHLNSPKVEVSSTPRTSNPDAVTTYDIDLLLERRFHIYGQGLDSTWKGRLAIEGTSDVPVYKGQFTLKEGQLRILDKFFDVQKGEIYFDGDLSPNLYIESNLNLQDMRVKIILEGDASNLQQKIISDAGLSEQEILQKLFFNRSSSMSQSFQALNYLASSSFISSFVNIGFYQQEDPITHVEREFVSLQQKFSKRTYGKVNVAISSVDSDSDRIAIAAGFQPTPLTKTEITFSPDNSRVGVGLEWSLDF